MKRTFTILFSIFSTIAFTQNSEKTSYFKLNNDTLTFFLDEKGDITVDTKAIFYRKSLIDKTNFFYIGKVEDFYINDTKAFQCSFNLGNQFGEAKCYYKNGQVKYQGYYKNSLRDSIWSFYYDNGQIEKIVQYRSDTSYLKEYYNKSGKIILSNSNGKYKGKVIAAYKDPTEYTISGNIKDGRFDGKWKWYGNFVSGEEYYDNGTFIRGSSNIDYSTDPIISLTGFDLHENVDVIKFLAMPQKERVGSGSVVLTGTPVLFNSSDFESRFVINSDNQPLKFKNSIHLNKEFSKDLETYLLDLIKKNQILNFWCFIQFTVTNNNKVENVLIHSNNDIISSNINRFISSLIGFEAVKIECKTVNCNVYMCVFCDNGKLNIPEYIYNSFRFTESNAK